MTVDREHDDRERWIGLVVAEARGDALSDADRDECLVREAADPELLAEAPVWRALGRLEVDAAADRERTISDAAMAAAVLARARAARRPPAPSRAWTAGLAAAGLAAWLAARALLTGPSDELPPDRPASPVSAAPMTRVEPPNEPVLWVSPGSRARLDAGACAAITDDLDVCALAPSELRLEGLAPTIDLHLFVGELLVLAADEPTTVRLAAAGGTITASAASFRARLDDGDLELRSLAGAATLDPAPGSPDLTLGALDPATRSPDAAPAPRRLAPRPRPRPRPPTGPTAEALLADAQVRLADGETAAALLAYEALLARHPDSVEARTALVSLGNLRLQQGQAAAALRSFERYLAGDGQELAEEALYGKIRALHRLGRAGERDAAAADLLARFPASVYAPRVRDLADR